MANTRTRAEIPAETSLDAKALAARARKAFAENTGHFDANAILRGAQLTVVGGKFGQAIT